ncbi:hypothetical protein SAMN05421741_102189 [Paenimyroides ummariense]|uniref:Uncharacterized protein n=1 Tax=Paenimyroides ummariense TaxID=913024 RepID=A0A1I4X938_9FLAO|nr:hypothetical protein [Paenimyroides ummariense]SFN22364.1 hypothetical protein SAMN05421741_102189 [Paenimyroides ummariense]
MKKFIYGAIMLLAVQTGFAQTQDAKTFVDNMGMKANIDGVKQQILPMIDTAKVDDFNKEFDALVNGFVTDFSKLVDENYDAAELKAANKKFAETKEVTVLEPKDKTTFEQKAGTLSNEVNMTMQGLVMKYASAEALQQAEE